MLWSREKTMDVWVSAEEREAAAIFCEEAFGAARFNGFPDNNIHMRLVNNNCVMYIVIQEFDDHHELVCNELIFENQAAALERVLMAGAGPVGSKGKILDPYGNFWMIKAKDKLMVRIWKIMKRISMLHFNMLRSFSTFIGGLVLSVAAVVAFLFLFKREWVNNLISYLVDKYGEMIVNSGLGWVLSQIVEWIKCKADRLFALFLALFRFFRN